MKTKLLLMITSLLMFSLSTSYGASSIEGIKNKIGAVNYRISGMNYSLNNLTTSDSGSDDAQVQGTAFFYERLLTSRFSMGFTFLSVLDRNAEFSVGGVAYESDETISVVLIDFKSYFNEHKRKGGKKYVGVSFGTFTSNSTLKYTSGSSKTEKSTSAAVPISALSFGYDWVQEFGGLRFDFTLLSGKRSDADGYDSHEATYDYTNSSVFGIGVYSFF